MYNEELELLIDAALTDGVLTEKEKQILFKKAQGLGVDLDEFNMVLESRLQKIKLSAAPKESNKRGVVKKCPNCGAVVTDPSATRCSECGFIFDDAEVNSSMKKLLDKIVEIQEKYSEKISNTKGLFAESEAEKLKEACDKEMSTCILTFPISKSKSDLLEFISGSMSQVQSVDNGKVRNAWRGKWKECISKAQMFYPGDTDFAPLIQQWQTTQTFTNKIKIFLDSLGVQGKIFVIGAAALLFCILMGVLAHACNM